MGREKCGKTGEEETGDMLPTMKAATEMVRLGDKTWQMDFDMGALAMAEQVYRQRFGQTQTVYEIVEQIFEVQTSAIMALAYGALVSGGAKISWEQFAKEIFTFEHYDAIAGAVADGMGGMFGPDDGEAGEGDAKNGSSRGAS